MNEFVLIWKVNPLENHSQWLCIWPDCRTQRADSLEAALSVEDVSKAAICYSNIAVEHLNTNNTRARLIHFNLTPFEYRYVLGLLDAYLPDFEDESSILSNGQIHRTETKLKRLMQWVGRFHAHRILFEKQVGNNTNVARPSDSFRRMAQWLQRRSCRIYAEGAVMDKHVYCARWAATHWPEMIRLGVASTPTRDAGMLKACRTDPARVLLIEQAAFILVNFSKTTVDLDYPAKQSVWVSNAELNAIAQADPKTRFEVEDLLVFAVSEFEPVDVLVDESYELAVTHGIVARCVSNQFDGTWTMAYWRSMERANWISLIAQVKKQFQVVISGYGDGYLSFYCWEGEMARLTEMLRLRAAVLKQSDQDFDAEFKQELRSLLQSREDSLNATTTDNDELDNDYSQAQTAGI